MAVMNLNVLFPTRSLIYESPCKIYVGNLANITKPEQLREFFSQFGTVLSVKVLYDTKGHNHRTFAFVSFSYSKELKDAIYSNGTDFLGRKILVRKAIADNTSAVNRRWSKFYSIESFFPRLYKWNTLVNPPAIEDPVSRFS